jgi:hypothetical protein
MAKATSPINFLAATLLGVLAAGAGALAVAVSSSPIMPLLDNMG